MIDVGCKGGAIDFGASSSYISIASEPEAVDFAETLRGLEDGRRLAQLVAG